jgi:type IV pilus assembly protein PilM
MRVGGDPDVTRFLDRKRGRSGPIGIDFGSRFTRLIQLDMRGGQCTIAAAAQVEIPPGEHAPEERKRLRDRAVAESLESGAFHGRDIVVSVGWDDLQVRSLRVPNMPEDELFAAVRYEASERFGLDPEAAELRFVPAGEVRQGTEVRQEVIAFGVAREAVETQLERLAEMGLNPVAIDADPCAVFRGFERFLQRDEDVSDVNAFVDLGYGATRVILSRGPEMIFFKSIPIGGRRFDQLVAKQLGLSEIEAAQIRVRLHRQHVAAITGHTEELDPEETVGETLRQAVVDALRPALEQLSKEIALCLRYCSVTFRGLRTDAVTVVGGEACNADTLRLLSDQVNVPFHVGKAARHLGCDAAFHGADRRTGLPEWATAIGLALKPVPDTAEVLA